MPIESTDAEQAEVIGGNDVHMDPLDLPAIGDCEIQFSFAGDLGQSRRWITTHHVANNTWKLGINEASQIHQLHQLLGPLDRQRPQQQSIYERR